MGIVDPNQPTLELKQVATQNIRPTEVQISAAVQVGSSNFRQLHSSTAVFFAVAVTPTNGDPCVFLLHQNAVISSFLQQLTGPQKFA